MADKGFDLKVLIPTDDGLTVSDKGIEYASYYLAYNVSNRSYQLAGKYKSVEIFKSKEFSWQLIQELCDQDKVDKLVSTTNIAVQDIEYIIVQSNEISVILNILIDQIDNINNRF